MAWVGPVPQEEGSFRPVPPWFCLSSSGLQIENRSGEGTTQITHARARVHTQEREKENTNLNAHDSLATAQIDCPNCRPKPKAQIEFQNCEHKKHLGPTNWGYNSGPQLDAKPLPQFGH